MLISGTCEVTLGGKRDSADGIKFRILRWADYLGISHELSEGSFSVAHSRIDDGHSAPSLA